MSIVGGVVGLYFFGSAFAHAPAHEGGHHEASAEHAPAVPGAAGHSAALPAGGEHSAAPAAGHEGVSHEAAGREGATAPAGEAHH